MKAMLTLFFFLVSWSHTLLFAEARTSTLAREILPAAVYLDEELSSEAQRNRLRQSKEVYLFDGDVESLVSSIKAAGVALQEWEHRTSVRSASGLPEGLEGIKKLKKLRQDQIEDPIRLPDYQQFSGKTTSGSVVIVSSHYLDPEEKRWIKKTNVTLIAPLETRISTPEVKSKPPVPVERPPLQTPRASQDQKQLPLQIQQPAPRATPSRVQQPVRQPLQKPPPPPAKSSSPPKKKRP